MFTECVNAIELHENRIDGILVHSLSLQVNGLSLTVKNYVVSIPSKPGVFVAKFVLLVHSISSHHGPACYTITSVIMLILMLLFSFSVKSPSSDLTWNKGAKRLMANLDR